MKITETLKTYARPILVLVLCLTMAAGAAFAVQTALTPVVPIGPYVTGQPTAGSLALAWTQCDASNGNSFPITGREILLVQNEDTMAAHTFTVSSVADALGRTNDVTAYSVALSSFAAFNFRSGVTGWKQSDGTVHMACSTNNIYFAVLTTPS